MCVLTEVVAAVRELGDVDAACPCGDGDHGAVRALGQHGHRVQARHAPARSGCHARHARGLALAHWHAGQLQTERASLLENIQQNIVSCLSNFVIITV